MGLNALRGDVERGYESLRMTLGLKVVGMRLGLSCRCG
jgi:hypothetical protein